MTECASAPRVGRLNVTKTRCYTLSGASQRSEHLSENISDVKLHEGSKTMRKWVIRTLCVGVRAQGGGFLESTK